jgi:hypothetical protein
LVKQLGAARRVQGSRSDRVDLAKRRSRVGRRLGERRARDRQRNAVLGSGYAHLGIPPWTTNNKVYEFSSGGK